MNSAGDSKEELKRYPEEKGHDDIYNSFEAGLNGKALPCRALVSLHEDSSLERNTSKKPVTPIVCANSSAGRQIPLLLFKKSRKPRSLKNLRLSVVNSSQL
ncbi:hypothetical protein M514_09363 [Trichuris suis]|uniref:Uncharacterized protein n=1 Tax=Trichuris suis TaxID=68888 RepID=A0A085LXS2_9BILA|nr:hypothetical protein M513_09363 [Trichuris suis]KFD68513.1 hypothetical protein M514_09363 [Trichuris suis]